MENSTETSKPAKGITRREFLKLPVAALAGAGAALLNTEKAVAAEQKNGSYLVEREYELLGSKITFLGVSHNLATFREYKSLFTKQIRNSDIVVSEYLPFEPTTAPLKKATEVMGSGNSSFRFYEQIAQLAKEEQKPLAAIDPESFYLNFWKGVGEPGLILAATLNFTIEDIRLAKLRKKYHFDKKQPQMSRRAFLKKTGLLGLSAIMNYNFPFAVAARAALAEGRGKPMEEAFSYGYDDKFIPDTINYRNIQAGRSLRRLCKHFQQQGGKKITIIAGLAHMYPIMEYAQNKHRLEIALKKVPHFFYDIFGNNSVRIYDYDSTAGKWVKRPEIE